MYPVRPTGRPFTPEERESLTAVSPLSIQRKIVSATLTRMCSGKRTWASDLKHDLKNVGWSVLNSWDPECDSVELLKIGVDLVLANDRSASNKDYLAQHLTSTPLPWEYQDRVKTLRKAGWYIRACDYAGSILHGYMVDLKVLTVSEAEITEKNIETRRSEIGSPSPVPSTEGGI